MLILLSMQRYVLLGCLVSLLACDGESTLQLSSRMGGTDEGAGGGGDEALPEEDLPIDPPCVPGTTADPLPLRRLTRSEYDNTVRDLLGSTQIRGDKLPPDEKT